MARAADLALAPEQTPWRRIAPWIAVLVLAFPLIVWPLIENKPEAINADLMPAQPDQPGILNRLYFPPIFLMTLLAMAQARDSVVSALREPTIQLLMLFMLWAGTSFLWAFEPEIMLRRYFLQVMIVVSIVGSVIAARDPAAVLRHVFYLFACVVFINTVALFFIPPGRLGFQGFYPQKNFLGEIVGVVFVLSVPMIFAAKRMNRVFALVVSCLAMILLLATKSKNSIGLAFVAPVLGYVTFLLARNLRISPAITVAVGFTLVTITYQLGVALYLFTFDDIARFLFGDPTLTHRTEIWAFAVKMIERQPFLGYGFDAFWGVSYDSPSIREAPGFVAKMPHGHNGYLDLIVHTGIIGLAIALSLILTVLHAVGGLARRAPALCASLLSILLFCILHNFLESGWFRGFNPQNMTFLLTAALAVSAKETS